MIWVTIDAREIRRGDVSEFGDFLGNEGERTTVSDRKEEWTVVKRKLTERFKVVKLNIQCKIIIYLLHGIFSTLFTIALMRILFRTL